MLKQNAQVFNQKAQGHGEGGRSRRGRGNPTVEVLKQFRAHPAKLFRGYTALAARNLPFTGLQFPIFERLKAYFLDRRKRKKTQEGGDGKADGIFERARITALSAALAGTGAAWITTPIDVLKTRIMLGAGDEAKKGPPSQTKNNVGGTTETMTRSARSTGRQTALALTKEILKNEGIRGMFRGALLRSLWTAFGSGLYLGCYAGGRHYLEERRRGGDEGGDVVMEREKEKDWKGVKVGVGGSRSQRGGVVRRSEWQE